MVFNFLHIARILNNIRLKNNLLVVNTTVLSLCCLFYTYFNLFVHTYNYLFIYWNYYKSYKIHTQQFNIYKHSVFSVFESTNDINTLLHSIIT